MTEGQVVVVGAGIMGRGIAYVTAVGGTAVHLVDVSDAVLADARVAIDRDLDAGTARGKVTPESASAARDLLRTMTSLDAACGGASLVIEAVIESVTVKHQVIAAVERAAPADAVLATNTSALSVTELGAALADPSRFLGMHFFNPVPKMALCELVRSEATSEATLERAEAAARRMGKVTVRVNDRPGFATSRLNALLGNEGFRMLEEGVATAEDIDTAARLGLNHPMGPLEMADLVGLDVRLAVLEHLAATLGDRFAPSPTHRRLVAEGRLGRKTGHGVYRYGADGARLDEPSDLP